MTDFHYAAVVSSLDDSRTGTRVARRNTRPVRRTSRSRCDQLKHDEATLPQSGTPDPNAMRCSTAMCSCYGSEHGEFGGCCGG